MKNCIFCGKELFLIILEHIILNAIGGRLGVTDLDCGECNTKQNDQIDTVLARELNHITNLLDVKRERRGFPAALYGISGEKNEEVKLAPGGRPELTKPGVDIQKEEKVHHVSITARSESEFRQILNGLKKNGYDIDVEEEVRNAQWQSVHPGKVNLQISVGSPEALRSICKTALLFYLKSGGKVEHVADAIAYVKGEKKGDFVRSAFQPPVSSVGISGVTHTVYVKGDTKDKTLYAWVEYYGTYGFGVILNENYQGEEFEASYCFDVLEQKELVFGANASISEKELFEAVKEKKFSSDRFTKKHEVLNQIIQQKQIQEYLGEKSAEIMKKHFPTGTTLTPEKYEAYLAEMAQVIATMIKNQNS